MGFFKRNSYEIVRLYIYQIGITIFSLALYTAVGTIEDTASFNLSRIAVSVFAYGFYLFLVYYGLWEVGAKDKIRIDGGKGSPEPFKGLLLSLFSNVPNLVLALLSLVFVVIFRFSGAEGIKSVFIVFYIILRFHSSIFMGFIGGVTRDIEDATSIPYINDCILECSLYLIIPLLTVAFGHFAYTMGTKERKLFGKTNK